MSAANCAGIHFFILIRQIIDVILVDGIDESEYPVSAQIIVFDIIPQVHRQTPRYELNERSIFKY